MRSISGRHPACFNVQVFVFAILIAAIVSRTALATDVPKSNYSPTPGGWATASIDFSFDTSATATCRWADSMLAYSAMPGANECAGANSLNQTCSVTGLTPTSPPTQYADVFYIACDDAAANPEEDMFEADNFSFFIDLVDPPTPSFIYDGTGADEDTVASTTNYPANWEAVTDAESGLDSYWYAIGSATATPNDVVDWTQHTTTNSIDASGLSLTSGNTYYFSVKAMDNAGRFSSVVTSDGAYVDGTTPVASGWSPATGSTIMASATISFTTDENATCKWQLFDQSYEVIDNAYICSGSGTTSHACPVSGMVEGAEVIYFNCTDAMGNAHGFTDNYELDYVVDTAPPVQSLWSPWKSSTMATSTPVVTFTTNEAAWCRWSLTDQAYGDMVQTCSGGNSTSHSCSVSGLVEGTDYVYVACTDIANNEDTTATNEDIDYIIDFTPPVLSGISPTSGSTINTATATISLTANENAWCLWSLTDQDFDSMPAGNQCWPNDATSITCTAGGLSEGANSVHIACKDSVDNKDDAASNEDLSYTMDTAPPVQSNWSPAKGSVLTSSSQTITLNTNENATCRWSLTDTDYDSMSGNTCTGGGGMSHSCSATGMQEGVEFVYVACVDDAGNKDDSLTNENIDYSIDTQPPIQDNWSPATGTITTTTPTLTFDTDENAGCRWALTDSAFSAMTTPCAGTGTAFQTCSVTGLSQGTNTVHTSCSDAYGNADSSTTNSDLDYFVDSLPPVQSGWSPADLASIDTTSPNVVFSTNENAWCRWSTSDQSYTAIGGNNCTGSNSTSHTCAVTGLVEGTDTVHFACLDAAGNSHDSTTNTDLSYKVDLSAPVQSAWSPATSTVLTTTAPTITLSTDENAWCAWSLSDQTYSAIVGNACTGSGGTSHSCSASGLVEGSDTVYIACRDSIFNEHTAGTNTDLDYTIDITAPVQSAWAPADSSVLTAATDTITLTTNENAWCRWSLTDLSYTAIGGNDCGGAGTTSHSCAVTGMSEGANTVSIACRDASSNEHSASTNTDLSYSVDTTLPVQSNWSPADSSYINTTTPTLTFDTDENAGCRWSLSDLSFSGMAGNSCAGTGTMSQSCSVTGLAIGTETVHLACSDSAGNQDTSSSNTDLTFIVDTTKPTQSNWNPANLTALATSTPLITLDTDESATCRWDLSDLGYTSMNSFNSCGALSTSHNCQINGLVDGTASVYIACSDPAGNSDTNLNNTDLTYTIDAAPPAVQNLSPAHLTTLTASTASVTFDTNETAWCRWATSDLGYDGMSTDCTGGGSTSFTCAISGMSNGLNRFYIACKDSLDTKDNSLTNEDIIYYMDTNPPAKSLWNPADGASIPGTSGTVIFMTDENATCRWALTDLGYSGIAAGSTCAGGGGTSQSCGYSGLAQATNTLYFACTDAYGNEDTSSNNSEITYYVDTAAPALSGFSPATGTVQAATTISISFTADEDSYCKWATTDIGYISMTNSCSGSETAHTCAANGLSEGAVTVYVACEDSALNRHTDSDNYELAYTVDITPPVQSNWSPANNSVLNVQPTVTFDTDENASCQWALTDQAYADMSQTCTGSGTMSHSCSAAGMPEATSTLYIACADTTGTEDTADTNTELSYNLITTTPIQSNWSPANESAINTLAPAVSFDTNKNANCSWSLTDQAYGDMTQACTGEGSASHSCSVTGLAEGTATVFIACDDLFGNTDTTDSNTDLAYTVDITLNAITNLSPAAGSVVTTTSPQITFDSDENLTCRWDTTDLAYSSASNNCETTGATSHACTATGLSEGAANIYIACTDAAGNEHSASTNADIDYIIMLLLENIQLYKGWNLAGIPVENASITPESAFGEDEYEIMKYNGTGYENLSQQTTISPQITDAFWIYSGNDKAIETGGTDITANSKDISMTAGWNFFSSPYNELSTWSGSTATLTCNSGAVTLPDLYAYSPTGGYYTTTDLLPWMGYLIKVPDDAPCTLTLTR